MFRRLSFHEIYNTIHAHESWRWDRWDCLWVSLAVYVDSMP
jgi:hypothetical protein